MAASNLNKPMNAHNRVYLVAIVAASFMAIIVFHFAREHLNPKSFPIAGVPDDCDVQMMTASLVESDLGFAEVEDFEVPRHHISRILYWFRPSTHEKTPPILRNLAVGTLNIETNKGRKIILKFYSAGHNPPLFTTDENKYYWGGGTLQQDNHGVDGGIAAGKAIVAAYLETVNSAK